MMKINKKIFDLETVYTKFSHVEAIEVLTDLETFKIQLKNVINELRLESSYNKEAADKILIIEEQLRYLNQNIRTFEDAILCHESKTFQKMGGNNIVSKVCLN